MSIPKVVGYALHQVSYVSTKRAGDLALHLFGRPMAGRPLPEEQRFLETAEEQYQVPFENGQVTVYEWNAQQPESVLLLHGWESNAARWETLIGKLVAVGKRVLAVDAPAHGASSGKLFNMLQYSRVLAILVDTFQPNAVVGHSIGGGATALYLNDHPHTPVQRAIIMGVPSELRHMANTFARVLGLSQRMRQTMEQQFQRQYELTFEDVSIAKYCEQINLPTLVIHDEQDSVAPVADAYRYQQHLAQGELLLTTGLGHSLQGTKVYEGIVNFLQ